MDNVTTNSSVSDIDLVKDLTKKGLFLDAYNQAVAAWGELEDWKLPEQQTCFIPLSDRLGRSRAGDYLRLKLARQFPENIDYQLKASYLLMPRKGPFCVWQISQKLLALDAISEQQKAEAYLLQALVSSSLRDFEIAEAKLKLSGDIVKDDWWNRVQGYILTDKEEFTEASAWLQQCYEANPTEQTLLQFTRALEQTASPDSVIDLLEAEAPKFQSIRPWLSLAHLYKEQHTFEKIEHCLTQVNSLLIGTDRPLSSRLNYLNGHLKLSKKHYSEAQADFEKCHDFFSKTIAKNLSENEGEKTVKLDVPFIKQKYLTCAPASISGLLRFHGISASQDDIANKICYDGTPDYLQHQWLNDNNIPFVEFDLEWDIAKQLLDKSLPFTLVTHSGTSSHLQVVTGYNEKTGILYLMDPSNPGVQEILAKEAIEQHAFVGPRCMVFLPFEKARWVEDLEFPSKEIYNLSRNFHTLLRHHKVNKAKEVLAKLQNSHPDHRLTLLAARSIAIYLKDELLIEQATNELIVKYPHETWLASSRYYSLHALGRRDEGLEFLKEKIAGGSHYELIETFFLEAYEDVNYQQDVAQYIPALKRLAAHSAESNWILGHWYWSKGSQNIARQFYRWAITLNDRDERYSESFFKSSIWNGTTKNAIAFLKRRWQNYSSNSSGPALSLYNALAFTDSEPKGLSVLKKSLELRPNDETLVEFTLKRYLEFAKYNEFKKLYNSSKKLLSNKTKQSLKAAYCYAVDQHDKTEEIYKQLISEHPTERYFYDKLFRIMHARGENDDIDKQLDGLYATIGFTPFSAWLIIDWHSSDNLKTKMLVELVNKYPNDFAAVEKLANHYFIADKFDEAKSLLKKSINKATQSTPLLALLSRIELFQDNLDKAKQYALEAINLNIDSDNAFNALVACHLGANSRKKMLLEFFALIKQKVTNGDALWNFWHAAVAWLDPTEMKVFTDFIEKTYPQLWYTPILIAKQLVEENKLDLAVEVLEKAKSQFSLLPRVYYDLAETYLLLGETEKAKRNYRKVILLNPSWSMPARRYADLLEREGSIDQALQVLEKACRYNTSDGILYGLRADLKIKMGNNEEAIELLQKAVTLEIDYNWGWNTLGQLGEQLGKPNIAKDTAKRITDRSPHMAMAWLARARLERNPDDVIEYLNQGLRQEPKSVSLNRELIYRLLDLRDFAAAEAQINLPVWQQNIPITIHVIQADVYARQNRYADAIQWLEDYLKEHTTFVDGWRKLHDWYKHFDMYQESLKAAYKLVELEPHNANNLSLCAETLFNHGSDDDKKNAAIWLEKAFVIDPADMHVSLSWIDYLLDEGLLDQAEAAILVTKRLYQDALLSVREVRFSILKQQYNQLESLISSILDSNSNNTWVYTQTHNLLKDNKLQQDYVNRLLKLINEEKARDEVAQVWSYLQLSTYNNQNKVIEFLTNQTESKYWSEIAYQYLKHLETTGDLPKRQFVSKFADKLRQDIDLFGAYGFLLILNSKYPKAIKWYESRNMDEAVPGYIWYHYHWALMECGNWDKAASCIHTALHLEPDNCFNNICLWYVYFKMLEGHLIEERDLVNINVDDLSDMEKYFFALIKAVYFLRDGFLNNDSDNVFQQLRYAQTLFHNYASNKLAKQVKKNIHNLLKARIEDRGLFHKLRYRFKLSNHF